ncbi:MAG: ribosomal small subunit methyltransferase, partial [Candidatus Parcubacteria bacterium]
MQSQSEPQGHVAVLLHEAVNGLNLAQGGTFVDCTLGNAGHTLEIFKRFGNDIDYIGLDADPERLAYAKTLLSDAGCSAKLFNENFRDLDSALREAGVERASAILFDLGLNSEQLESSGRGFSFKHNEPLLMTFGKPQAGDLTAREIVNRYDEESLERILREYG